MHLLFQAIQPSDTMSIGNIFLTFSAALVGGGIVNFMIGIWRERRRAAKVKRSVLFEVQLNLNAIQTKEIQESPSISHFTWTSFYNSNPIEIISSIDDALAEKIIDFYSHIEMLQRRDSEDIEIQRYESKKDFKSAQLFRNAQALSKQSIRDTLVKLGKEILTFN